MALRAQDSRFGFEASNHYYYTQQDLKEKLLNLQYCKGVLRPLTQENRLLQKQVEDGGKRASALSAMSPQSETGGAVNRGCWRFWKPEKGISLRR